MHAAFVSHPLTRVAILAAALGLSAALARGDPLSHGKALVEANCARCHAVGRTDKSRHPDAPAFRTLSQRYPITNLEESARRGHFDRPPRYAGMGCQPGTDRGDTHLYRKPATPVTVATATFC
ncbi:c-type cytochrome (plasmid) [Mesorhizobium atlanticum]